LVADGNEGSVRSVERALDILLAFKPGDEALTVAELLKRVDLSRPTLYRLLGTLEKKEFIASNGEPQRFSLGRAIAQLTHVWLASLDVRTVAEPILHAVHAATAETVALYVPEGIDRVCVAEVESTQALRFTRGVGYRERLILGASGRAILAHLVQTPDELKPYTAGTKVDSVRLLEGLAQVKRRGFGVSKNELIDGAVAVAAPFFDSQGVVGGSLCVFGPSVRIDAAKTDEIGKLLVREASRISVALGAERKPGTKQAG
jgi:DNA-binding IclR family transcriptional regulator